LDDYESLIALSREVWRARIMTGLGVVAIGAVVLYLVAILDWWRLLVRWRDSA
jgi:hypothetical protein